MIAAIHFDGEQYSQSLDWAQRALSSHQQTGFLLEQACTLNWLDSIRRAAAGARRCDIPNYPPGVTPLRKIS